MLALLELLIEAAPALNAYFRFVVGVVVPLVVYIYAYNGILDLAAHVQGRTRLPLIGGVGLTLLVVGLVIAHRLPGGASPTPRHYMSLAAVGAGIPLLSALAVPVISTAVKDHIPTVPALIALLVTLAATIGVGVFCARTR